MPLTEIEKAAVRQFVNEGTSIKDIKQTLGKGSNSRMVEKYIEGISDPTLNIPQTVYNEAAAKLATFATIQNKDASKLIDKAIVELKADKETTVDDIVSRALQIARASDMFTVTSENSGQKITAMSFGASSKVDKSIKSNQQEQQEDNPNIFKIK